jgi:hypothetical protein
VQNDDPDFFLYRDDLDLEDAVADDSEGGNLKESEVVVQLARRRGGIFLSFALTEVLIFFSFQLPTTARGTRKINWYSSSPQPCLPIST